jgi:DnaA family protein
MYVPLSQVMEFEPAILDDLESIEYLGIDDIHLAAGNNEWELALFNLFNRTLGAGSRLLMSSACGPQNLQIDLPDLKSRLNSGLVCRLADLDDHDKQAVLQLRAARRGLFMSDTVARYLIRRLRRDMRELNTIFERIDGASLSTGRELTIPFVRDVLGLD